jgi:hypothetical protein
MAGGGRRGHPGRSRQTGVGVRVAGASALNQSRSVHPGWEVCHCLTALSVCLSSVTCWRGEQRLTRVRVDQPCQRLEGQGLPQGPKGQGGPRQIQRPSSSSASLPRPPVGPLPHACTDLLSSWTAPREKPWPSAPCASPLRPWGQMLNPTQHPKTVHLRRANPASALRPPFQNPSCGTETPGGASPGGSCGV